MVDKLEEKLSPFEMWRPGVLTEMTHAALRGADVPGLESRGGHYAVRVDLRPYGVDAKLHLANKVNGCHKLEHLDSGKKTFEQILQESESVCLSDPLTHEVMRLDLAADVPGVPVNYFRNNARVQFKRFGCEHGRLVLEYSAMGRREVQTLYFGKRPNCIRIYDKVAEWLAEYRRDLNKLRRASAEVRNERWSQFMGQVDRLAARVATLDGVQAELDLPGILAGMDAAQESLGVEWLDVPNGVAIPPIIDTATLANFPAAGAPGTPVPFRERYGVEADDVLTRVERQIGADRIDRVKHRDDTKPFFVDADGKALISCVWQRLPKFNPFESIKVEAGRTFLTPHPSQFSPNDYLKLRGLLTLLEEKGKQFTWSYLNEGRNAARVFKKFGPYIPPDFLPDEAFDAGEAYHVDVSEARLLETYQQSIARQLAV